MNCAYAYQKCLFIIHARVQGAFKGLLSLKNVIMHCAVSKGSRAHILHWSIPLDSSGQKLFGCHICFDVHVEVEEITWSEICTTTSTSTWKLQLQRQLVIHHWICLIKNYNYVKFILMYMLQLKQKTWNWSSTSTSNWTSTSISGPQHITLIDSLWQDKHSGMFEKWFWVDFKGEIWSWSLKLKLKY
jgi:hypothetical protein